MEKKKKKKNYQVDLEKNMSQIGGQTDRQTDDHVFPKFEKKFS